MFILQRNDTDGKMIDEFKAIRNKYHSRPITDTTPFGTWLRELGTIEIESIITSIPESDIRKGKGTYKVEEIHFKSEAAYLAFKLKYL